MSRSYLRDKYTARRIKEIKRYKGKDLMHLEPIPDSNTGNEHKRDEMPKKQTIKINYYVL